MSSPQQRRTLTAPGGGGPAGGGGGGAAWGGAHQRTLSMGLPSPGGRMLGRQASTVLSPAEEVSMAAAQELASVMNAPPTPGAGSSWLGAWPFAQAFGQEDYDAPPPPLPPGTLPDVQLADFSRYLRSIGDRLEGLERTREASQQRMQNALSPEELRASQGQGLVAAMREVPAAFFQEAFDLDQRQLWEELVQVGSEEARQESLDRLSGYLDVVETHLVREIAARTDNFFDASGYVQDVRGNVARLYERVSALRQQMHALEQETAAAVATSQHLQQRRANLMAALDVLRAVEAAAQAQSALDGLLPRSGGVAVDYAGAIDVLEVLQGVLDDELLLTLDCFKHLPGQIVETGQAVDDLMTSDFLERTRFPGAVAAANGILDRLRAQAASQASSTPRRKRTSSSQTPSRQLSAEESLELERLASVRLDDAAAVDTVVGWLERAAGGGADNAAAVAAAAAVAFGVGAGEEEDGGGGGESLQEVLLPLVIGLRRMGRLHAVMKDWKSASSARLKEFLSHIIEGCLDVLDPEAAPGDTSHLLPSRPLSPGHGGAPHPSAGASSPERDAHAELSARLARLPGQDFQWVLEAVLLASKQFLNHCTAVGEAVQTILAAAKANKQQLAAAAADCKECCQAVAEAAAGRWSKLLGGRARGAAEGGTASAIRLGELQGVLEITDVLASLVERYGVRGVLGLRSALQQLCKAALDALHSRSLGKLATLLEQEQWMAVEVPPQFQQLVAELEERGASAAGPAGPAEQPAAAAAAAAAGGRQAAAAAEGSGPGGGGGGAGQDGRSSDGGEGGSAGGVPRKFTITPADGPAAGAADQQQQQQQQQGATPLTNGTALAAASRPAVPAAPSPVLLVGGKRYHVVNTQLLLLSMLRDYLAFRDAVPAFAAEVAQRVLELLKVFNSRTCQLVLGAGAMQVSGLKSITAKHLALSCQCLGAFMALHPALVPAFTQGLVPPRRDMLVADFGRALQDYRIHHEEVCSKLVAIMRERLSANLKQLPALAAGWPAGGAHAALDEAPAPSSFATTAAKQLGILAGALSPLLLPEELHGIFGRIGLMFSRTLAEAYELLEPHGAAWEQQLRADMQYLLNCLRNLPMDPAERDTNLEKLTELFERRFLFGPPAPAADRAAAAGIGGGSGSAGPAVSAASAAVQPALPVQQPAASGAAAAAPQQQEQAAGRPPDVAAAAAPELPPAAVAAVGESRAQLPEQATPAVMASSQAADPAAALAAAAPSSPAAEDAGLSAAGSDAAEADPRGASAEKAAAPALALAAAAKPPQQQQPEQQPEPGQVAVLQAGQQAQPQATAPQQEEQREELPHPLAHPLAVPAPQPRLEQQQAPVAMAGAPAAGAEGPEGQPP